MNNNFNNIASVTCLIFFASLPAVSFALATPSVPVVGSVSRAIEHQVRPGVPAYDYAPTVMKQGSLYKAWWCGTGPENKGDWIYYSTTRNFDDVWSSYRTVFSPTNKTNDFDGDHTCDPDILKIGSTYIMYYGGLATPDTPNRRTEIGIATSTNGTSWTRVNGGKSLIGPKNPENGDAYGAGQPSVVKVDDWYYMIYTTVWRPTLGAGPVGGEFAIRSTDSLFRSGVQELRNTGWVSIGKNTDGTLAVNRERRLFGGSHVFNLVYLANHNVLGLVHGGTTLEFMDLNFNVVAPPVTFDSPNTKEQRAIVRDELGHIQLSSATRYNVQMMMAVWRNEGDKNNIFYYDMGRQTFQLAIDGGQVAPSGYKLCAHEGQACHLTGSVRVAYGGGSKFAYRNYANGGNIECNNSVFGDPANGVAKACFYKMQ